MKPTLKMWHGFDEMIMAGARAMADLEDVNVNSLHVEHANACLQAALAAQPKPKPVAWHVGTESWERVFCYPEPAERLAASAIMDGQNPITSPLYAQPPKPAVKVKVKALEWERVVGDLEVSGSYKVDRMSPWLSGKPKKYYVQLAKGFGYVSLAAGLSSPEEAKAAAQADYERRILSALEQGHE